MSDVQVPRRHVQRFRHMSLQQSCLKFARFATYTPFGDRYRPLTPLTYVTIPDPLGVYDGNDFDDVLGFVAERLR